jgi:hypothetical protein
MSIPPAPDRNEWDVRYYYLSPLEWIQKVSGDAADRAPSVEPLLGALESFAAATAVGWRISRIKIENPVRGRRQLIVWLKRQKPAIQPEVLVDASPIHAT